MTTTVPRQWRSRRGVASAVYLTANYYTAPKIRVVPLNSNGSQDRLLGCAYAP